MHPHLSDAINHNIAKSEIDGGVFLDRLPTPSTLKIQTRNTLYTLRKTAGGITLQGHAKYCPEPTKAYVSGSTWGGSMLKVGFVGRGMRLEFSTDRHPGRIVTSEIQEVTEE